MKKKTMTRGESSSWIIYFYLKPPEMFCNQLNQTENCIEIFQRNCDFVFFTMQKSNHGNGR